MSNVTLFHDGCNICLNIEATMALVFATPLHRYEAVDLSLQDDRRGEAEALGIVRLPSLVIDGKVLRLDDHSSLAQHA